MPTSKLLIVTVPRSVRPVVSQKEIHKPLVSAERNRPGGQELVKVKERLIKSRSEPGREPGAPRWAGLAVSGQSPRGSQGEAGISWVRARVSAKEPEISPQRQTKVPTGGEA